MGRTDIIKLEELTDVALGRLAECSVNNIHESGTVVVPLLRRPLQKRLHRVSPTYDTALSRVGITFEIKLCTQEKSTA